MKRVVLDGKDFTDKQTAHAILKEVLELPDHYGNNLDALWDCLTTDFSKRMIVIKNAHLIPDQLGRYGAVLLGLLSRLHQTTSASTVVYQYEFK
ncbi:barstar family protein [Jeotgalibaca caeni]|uniref:barstar family protein n=1 Tax=Jeotgalibaca caeni TaxID=3028623 RepID=UPI00237D6591|nr:barstar family protein [Jeotgalibaca caeni]MDE1547670.1 barstar family protein [Jeotgalibaca caeni]